MEYYLCIAFFLIIFFYIRKKRQTAVAVWQILNGFNFVASCDKVGYPPILYIICTNKNRFG